MKSKKNFKKSYVAKDYAAALAVIQPVAAQCKLFPPLGLDIGFPGC